jgi:hypothetical protein
MVVNNKSGDFALAELYRYAPPQITTIPPHDQRVKWRLIVRRTS